MATFVLVPGGWHGAWVYEPVTRRLREAGHDARPVTLRGLGAEDDPAPVNLEVHIAEVCDLIRRADLREVHLCGHSSGGLVIAGVADLMPERLARLVYVDAYVPADGDSVWSLTSGAFRALFVAGGAGDGHTVAPEPGLDRRARAHPVGAFLQGVRLTRGPYRGPRTLVHASGWATTPFTAQHERLSSDPEWQVHVLGCGHNVMGERPEELVRVLCDPA